MPKLLNARENSASKYTLSPVIFKTYPQDLREYKLSVRGRSMYWI